MTSPEGTPRGHLSLSGMVDGRIDRLLALAREHLEMDVAFIGEFTQGRQRFNAVAGDADSFGLALGKGPELAATYCALMIDGRIPHVVPDTLAEPVLAELDATRSAGIGSYIGVPLRMPDGSLYGTLCCIAHQPERLNRRDLGFLTMLAELVADELGSQQRLDQLRTSIGDVLRTRSLVAAYQPIFDVRHGACLGVEALSRFPSSLGAPDVVFSWARDVGLGRALETLAVGRAVELLALLDPRQYVAVNVTPPVALSMTDHPSPLDRVPLDRVVLEVTETVAVEAYRPLREQLAPLRAAGLRLSIDDAGAGFASLHHIIELQPDIIKIDRSIIRGVASDRSRRSAARAFIALAADLEAIVVAEGVETIDELDAVRELGVHAVQGFLLARPSVDLDGLAELCRPRVLPTRKPVPQE